MSHTSRSNADLSMTVELLRTKIDLIEAGRPPTYLDAWRWASVYSVRFRRPYTLARVARAWGMSRATLYRHREPRVAARKDRETPTSDSDIVSFLREWMTNTPFPAERHRKLWARLRHCGMIVSRERVRRVVRQYGLLPQAGSGVLAPRPDLIWGIDAAKVRTDRDGVVFVILAVDHCTWECLAIDVVVEETCAAWHALIHRAIRYAGQHGDGHGGRQAPCVSLRHDNLGLFRDRQFHEPLRKLGFRCSPISPLYPQGNACAERFIRILRENLLAIRGFSRLPDLRTAVCEFRDTYNRDWLLSRWRYCSPQSVRRSFIPETLQPSA